MRRLLCGLPACALAGFAVPVWADDSSTQYTLEIEQQPIVAALTEFSRQTGMQVGYLPESPEEENTIVAPLKGQYTVESALKEMLKPSGLGYERVNERTIAIAAPYDGKEKRRSEYAGAGRIGSAVAVVPGWRVASLNFADEPVGVSGFGELKNDKASGQATTAIRGEAVQRAKGSASETVEEIVVTGTHIRGATSSASPIQVYDRDQIDLTGLGSVQDFVRRLPQNFGGGVSENAIISGRQEQNDVQGTAINLRGLGSTSTLVLINGRRVAASNTDGNFVDVSVIPLAAVERMDVMPDGASAIYGSDAVGGVVNFILRRDFGGAETRARYGIGTQEAPEEFQVGQTLGDHWDSGSALVSYEYFDRSALLATERSFTEPGHPNLARLTLLPEQQRHGGLVSLDKTISDSLDLFSSGSYSHRSTGYTITTPGRPLDERSAKIEAYSAVLGARAHFADRFDAELSSSYSASDTLFTSRIGQFEAPRHAARQADTSILSVDATLGGPLWSVPAGVVLFALGGQYRDETLETLDQNLGVSLSNNLRRDVLAGFLELQIPLLGRRSTSQLANQLEVTLAARTERYSDFGSTTNPKVGLVWRPTIGLRVRGTYGTSFRAPLLSQIAGAPTILIVPQFDPTTGGRTNVFDLLGTTPLDPEKATIWTLGMDLQPEKLPGLRASLTYYDIHYEDRIDMPLNAGIDILGAALENADSLGRFVQRNPSLALLSDLLASASRVLNFTSNPNSVDLATIGAIADNRLHNFLTTNTNGVDFSVSFTKGFALANLTAGVDGTYILEHESQFLPTVSPVELINAPYLPADLKLRAQGIVSRGGVSIAAFINYVDSYVDARTTTTRITGGPMPVSSWTTADLSITYAFDKGPLDGLAVTLAAANITNKAPPFVRANTPAAFPGVNYDGANANALGRFVSLQFSKRWLGAQHH